MTAIPTNDPAAHAATMLGAAFGWWRAAGVDCAFVDDPQDWLAVPQSTEQKSERKSLTAQAAAPSPARIGGDRALWPQTLEDFASWWMTSADLPFVASERIRPSGPASAATMVLVPMPEDGDTQHLLSGKTGKLLDAMLAAMGTNRASIYLASALPSRVTMPDWHALATQGLGDILAHHLALAKPQRLLIFGKSGISTLLGHDLPNNPDTLRAFNQEDHRVSAVSAFDLEAILAKPALKAGLWNRLLQWTGTEPSDETAHEPR